MRNNMDTKFNRVTQDDIEAAITDERYINLGDALINREVPIACSPVPEAVFRTTLCVLTLDNGVVVVGKSACIDPRMFDARTGRTLARLDALSQVWPLLGMRLADRVAAGERVGFDPLLRPLTGPGRFGPTDI